MGRKKKKRSYQKKARAESEEQTRLRITQATVKLHGTKGPANTTISDVAKLAGVSRVTVYSHFPDEVALFGACSSHWATDNPFPDPGSWLEFNAGPERLRAGLAELYTWFEDKEYMLGKVFRDLPNVPALQTVMSDLWNSYVDGMVDVLAKDWNVRGNQARQLRAILTLMVSFDTWQSLFDSLESSKKAAALAARLVESAFTSDT